MRTPVLDNDVMSDEFEVPLRCANPPFGHFKFTLPGLFAGLHDYSGLQGYRCKPIEAKRACPSRREINHPPRNKRTAIGNRHHHRLTVLGIGYTHLAAKRQASVSSSQSIVVELNPTRCLGPSFAG